MASGRWGLKITARLFLVVFGMMILTLGASFVLSTYYERKLIDDIGDQYESLSKALQISVQQLTAAGETDTGLLRRYVQQLSKNGVREISILSSEKELVASSNPKARIGQKAGPVHRRGKPGPLVITGTLGEQERADSMPKNVQDIEIPIVVDDEDRGYVRLHLVLDDLESLVGSGYRHRLTANLLVFLAGFAGLVGLSFGMTRDIDRVSAALQQVAKGELPPTIESKRHDEIGTLIGTINGMVDRLREQRALEARLRRAERMSAIGHLAAAVAHEIRNPLNLISLSIDHLRDAYRPADPGTAASYLGIVGSVREELDRLNHLVGEFLTFGRPPALTPRACRLDEIVDDVVDLTRASAAEHGVEVTRAIAAELPALWADPGAVRTCLVNLVVNAVQSMPGGGRLAIDAAPARDGDGRAVEIAVSDNGPGIDPAHIERIFEPWFSTKAGGFGLGLAITQRIVEDSGGKIGVTSRPGEGTTFRMEWPAAADPAAMAEHAGERADG